MNPIKLYLRNIIMDDLKRLKTPKLGPTVLNSDLFLILSI